MPQITVQDREGNILEVEATEGYSLMETLRDIDNGVEAICGGMCSCATCHIYVADDWMAKLSPCGDEEQEILEDLQFRQENSRLSCQINVDASLEGIRVTVAPEE